MLIKWENFGAFLSYLRRENILTGDFYARFTVQVKTDIYKPILWFVKTFWKYDGPMMEKWNILKTQLQWVSLLHWQNMPVCVAADIAHSECVNLQSDWSSGCFSKIPIAPPLGNFSASCSRSLSFTFSTSSVNVFKYSAAFPATILAWHKRLSNEASFFFSYKTKKNISTQIITFYDWWSWTEMTVLE